MLGWVSRALGQITADLSLRAEVARLDRRVNDLELRVEYLNSQFQEFLGCGIHTTHYHQENAPRKKTK